MTSMSSESGGSESGNPGSVRWWRDPSLRPMIVACLTLSAAVGVFGVSFGVGSVAAGASVAQTCVISLVVFTGASQFSAVSVIGAGGSIGSALGGALLLAARNGVYGMAMSRRLDGGWGRKLLAAQLTIDETTAMAVAQPTRREQQIAFWLTGGALYVCWNLGTLIGALAGSAIDPTTYGLDVAFPAGFVAMVWPILSKTEARIAAVVGAVVCLIAVPMTPVGVPILLSVIGVLAGLRSPDDTVIDHVREGIER
jgi:4-azaleucine resistance transporter AzlC